MNETRQLLLEAATDEFARKGYAEANVNQISQTAGFAKGTIYNYFVSKRALMLALIDEIARLHLEFVAGPVQAEQEASRRVKAFFTAGFDFVSSHLSKARVMVNNLYGPDAEFKEVMYYAYQPMFDLVSREIIEYGMAQGVFRQVEPISTANLFMTIYLGTASQVDEMGKSWLDGAQVADFVVRGLSA
ncbi:MAG: TetR/AcrR family transcriptional regulator [Caldilineaceae bacterium]|nr:TetR/AcrR family transcriptional regulator [Caldilineaceae bacterium]